jgi:hypothetical protein
MDYMIKGSTQQFRFILPRPLEDISVVRIVFWQERYDGPAVDRKLPIIKSREHCSTTDNPNELTVILNQEETLRFTEDRIAYVQARAVTVDGLSYASKKREVVVYPVYGNNILNDNIEA